MKLFKEEIEKFYNLFMSKGPFALNRFGDGEMLAIAGADIWSGFGEWRTAGPDQIYIAAQQALLEALTWVGDDYYVGIVCPCCQGQHSFEKMKRQAGQLDDNLTYANLFVNGNYKFFVEKFVPEFNNRKIILITNKIAQVNNLPFSGVEFYPVGYNAWIDYKDIVDYYNRKQYQDHVFLFACGPLGKILCHKLWRNNPHNQYLDIGSTLNPWIHTDINIRNYYQEGTDDSHKTCVWG